MTTTDLKQTGHIWTAAELRRLPPAERDAILMAAAELAETDYRNDPQLSRCRVMSPTAEDLYESALVLPVDERVALAQALLESSEHPPAPEGTEEEYLAEIQRRSAETDPALWSKAEDALRRVHAKLGLSELSDG